MKARIRRNLNCINDLRNTNEFKEIGFVCAISGGVRVETAATHRSRRQSGAVSSVGQAFQLGVPKSQAGRPDLQKSRLSPVDGFVVVSSATVSRWIVADQCPDAEHPNRSVGRIAIGARAPRAIPPYL
jgi:hypothetical protein